MWRSVVRHEEPRIGVAEKGRDLLDPGRAVRPDALAPGEVRPLVDGDRGIDVSRLAEPDQNRHAVGERTYVGFAVIAQTATRYAASSRAEMTPTAVPSPLPLPRRSRLSPIPERIAEIRIKTTPASAVM